MTISKLRDNTFLIYEFEPRTEKDALKNEDWINVMNEEIDPMEKNYTWMLVSSVTLWSSLFISDLHLVNWLASTKLIL